MCNRQGSDNSKSHCGLEHAAERNSGLLQISPVLITAIVDIISIFDVGRAEFSIGSLLNLLPLQDSCEVGQLRFIWEKLEAQDKKFSGQIQLTMHQAGA